MILSYPTKAALQRFIDLFYGIWPQPLPDKDRLDQCKIISHRGEYDNRHIYENTLPAFDTVRNLGVWGIELDIRWTKDLHPVVFHDRNLNRLFHDNHAIADLTWTEIRKTYPSIPSLEEVVDTYGKRLHLMVEIKEETYPDPAYQNGVLKNLFSSLEPIIDFHVISLQPEMFRLIDFVPPDVFLPVAELNIHRLSNIAIRGKYRGITGHYLLLTTGYIERHHQIGQMVGTGFIRSKKCLFRELNRGIEWIFTNHAAKLQSILDAARAESVGTTYSKGG